MLLCIVAIKVPKKPQVIVGDSKTVRVEASNIFFEDFGEDDFTCTGLTWDENDNAFWIADYGALTNINMPIPRLVEVKNEFSEVVKILDLSNILSVDDNLQGIAFDKIANSLWLAVGDTVKNIDKDGRLLSEFDLGKYAKYESNGICVDETDDTLWVLCYSKYLLNYDKSGNLIRKHDMDYRDQDQLTIRDGMILATVGADYSGEENYVISINKNSGKTKVEYQTIGAYAVEGICIVSDKMYIVNDGRYHDAKIKNSYISV